MKLLRYGAAGKEKPGMLDKDGRIRDLSAVVDDITGEAIGPKGLARLKKIKPESLPLVRGKPRIGACIANPQKFIAIGLNYSDHAAESGLAVPKEPVVFTKQVSCLSGPYDDVTLPPKSKKWCDPWCSGLRQRSGRPTCLGIPAGVPEPVLTRLWLSWPGRSAWNRGPP